MISNSCVNKGVSCGVVIIFGDLVWGAQTILSSQLQCLSLGPLDGWGICPAATTGWDGYNAFSQPRNLGDFLSAAAGSLTALVVTCSSGVLAGVVPLMGIGFFSWNGGHLLQRIHVFQHLLIWEGEVTPHLFLQLLYTLHQQAWPPSTGRAGQFSLPNTEELGHMPPSSPISFLECLKRQRWNWVVARSSS